MSVVDVRDIEEARLCLLQSLACRRLASKTSMWTAMQIAYELASESRPILPVGFIADFCHLLNDHPEEDQKPGFSPLASLQQQRYEDLVLGKLYVDGTFERCGLHLSRYVKRDRIKALAYALHRVQARHELSSMAINPTVIRPLHRMTASELQAAANESVQTSELSKTVLDSVESLTNSMRNVGDLLGLEDLFELESGTALGGFGQRVALRQTMRSVAQFNGFLKQRPVVRESSRRQMVATRLQDEDAYPVGGFTSISTKGSIESLLHSQLAFMEGPDGSRPDLFDMKFLRDELLYYSRDENQFLRQRRVYVIVFDASLINARVKSADRPYQRIIDGIAAVVSIVEKLREWLTDESLSFEIVFPEASNHPLIEEQNLIELIFREQIESGTVRLHHLNNQATKTLCNDACFGALVHLMTLSTVPSKLECNHAFASHILLTEKPDLIFDEQHPFTHQQPESWDEMLVQWAEYLMV